MILRALARAEGNISAAAQLLASPGDTAPQAEPPEDHPFPLMKPLK
ncbi:hypothetical protein VXQ18_04420 [Brucella abortus]|nr:hypothetical protein [Brucella abortus]